MSFKIYLARPRGFCAGVDRAIEIVRLAIKKYGKPIYVKHAIVHNKYVVRELEKEGAGQVVIYIIVRWLRGKGRSTGFLSSL